MAEQKLDLIQFAAREVAETGAGAPQVVRGQLLDPGASRRGADDIPEHLGSAVSPNAPGLVDCSEHRAVRNGRSRRPRVRRDLALLVPESWGPPKETTSPSCGVDTLRNQQKASAQPIPRVVR